MSDAVRKILESVDERVSETATLAFLVEVLESYRTLRDADAQRLFAGLKGHLQYKLALAPDGGGIELTPGQNSADDRSITMRERSSALPAGRAGMSR